MIAKTGWLGIRKNESQWSNMSTHRHCCFSLTTLVLNVQKDNDNDDVGGRVMTIGNLAI
jgi:hypothetical protein